MKSKQIALTSELLNLWVLLWSPSQKGFDICKVEEMIGDGIKTMAGNLIEQDWVCVWISRDWEDCQAAADYFQKKS